MRVPYSWLKEFVDVDMPPEELAEACTMQGLAVETVEYPGRSLDGVVVGRVVALRPHPDADRLWCCAVDVGGKEPIPIVSGAPNMEEASRPKTFVLVALPGTTLPGGLTIEARDLRGEPSHGMLCSASELGLEEAESEGILLLHEGEPGKSAAEALGLDDAVFVFELTPNYAAHCQSVLGVAREVCALLQLPLKDGMGRKPQQVGAEPVRVEIEDASLCPRYTARLIRGVRVAPSPRWMQERLRLAGMRPINNVVDVTNYVMLERGQPLHAFDAQLLKGGVIRVRRAVEGETLETLDGQIRQLQAEDIVIADAERAVALAGVMGGANTEVSDATVDVLLEAAAFSPQHVARTSRRLGLRSEASGRFEKGLDEHAVAIASWRACQLFEQLTGGKVEGGLAEARPAPWPLREISVRVSRVNQLLGTNLDRETMSSLLQRLHMDTAVAQDGDTLRVTVPPFRTDVSEWVDIAEEIARLHGYNQIPARMPEAPVAEPQMPGKREAAEDARELLASLGVQEAVTFAFTSRRSLAAWGWSQEDARSTPVPLANPLGEEQGVLRTSLLPNLLDAVCYNIRQHEEDVALFEVGRVFLPSGDSVRSLPEEPLRLGMVMTGQWQAGGWQGEEQPVDFYLAKGLVERVESVLRLTPVVWQASAEEPGFHPGRTALMLIDDQRIGVVGELHPELLEKVGLRQRSVAVEIDLESWLAKGQAAVAYRSVPRYPAAHLDLAIVAPDDVTAAEVAAAIRTAAGELLERLSLFDVYAGEGLGEGRRSLAFHLAYRSRERTLREEEIQEVHERVREAVRRLGAELRS